MGTRKRVVRPRPPRGEPAPPGRKAQSPTAGKGTRLGRPRPVVRGTTAAVGVAVALASVLGMASVAHYLLTKHHGRGIVVRVTLTEDLSAAGVTRALWTAGVIETPWLFHALAWVTGAAESARPGVIVLRDDLTPRAVLRALSSGHGGLVRVTIPEGYTRFDIARRLASAGAIPDVPGFLRATVDPAVLARHGMAPDTSLEGRLFPDTYDLPLGGVPETVVERMVRVFDRRWAGLRAAHPDGVSRAVSLVGSVDADEALLILASMVERETGSPDDRPRIAEVFWNRLTLPDFRPRLLQSDPTVLYGCLVAQIPSCTTSPFSTDGGVNLNAPAVGTLTVAMLSDDTNPYNTYRHEGLPPGPVCNPGVRSLEAALAPSHGRDLYFVARGDGRSVFAATLDEHRRNVAQYLHRASRDASP